MKRVWTTVGDQFAELWRSDDYEVFVGYMDGHDVGRVGALHLSIKRLDRAPVSDWRHKQAIKNEIAGPFREAVELFPSEERLMDSANQTHLWVMPEGAELPVGFTGYAAFDLDDARRLSAQRGIDPAVLLKGRQRPWQDNISTGPDYARRMGWDIKVEES